MLPHPVKTVIRIHPIRLQYARAFIACTPPCTPHYIGAGSRPFYSHNDAQRAKVTDFLLADGGRQAEWSTAPIMVKIETANHPRKTIDRVEDS